MDDLLREVEKADEELLGTVIDIVGLNVRCVVLNARM